MLDKVALQAKSNAKSASVENAKGIIDVGHKPMIPRGSKKKRAERIRTSQTEKMR